MSGRRTRQKAHLKSEADLEAAGGSGYYGEGGIQGDDFDSDLDQEYSASRRVKKSGKSSALVDRARQLETALWEVSRNAAVSN